MKFIFKLIVISILSMSYSCSSSAFNFKEVKKGLVKINISKPYPLRVESTFGDFAGTGFIVDTKNKLVVTNRHVVDIDTQRILVTFSDGKVSTAKIVYIDPKIDVAVIQVNADISFDEYKELKLSTKDPKLERVFLAGNDENEGLSQYIGLNACEVLSTKGLGKY